MGATLREVAQAAGVSVATVSRAFTRPEKVDSATRVRVLHEAERLNYQPNRAARALSTGRTGMLGFIVPDLNNPFFSGILKGAELTARQAGVSLLIGDTDEDSAVEAELARQMSQRTDAIALCSSRMTGSDLRSLDPDSPVILINREEQGLSSVRFDIRSGIREAGTHLKALGHRRIAYVAGPKRSASNRTREMMLAQEFPALGLEVVRVGNYEPSFEGGRQAVDRVMLAQADAVMAYNDMMALGLAGRLLNYGVNIPGDISLIGWDDIDYSAMFTPALTTLHMPRPEAGKAAVEYLLNCLSGTPVEPASLELHLVVRASTGRAKATD